MNVSTIPSMAAFQALLLGGFWLSWAYLGGLVFAGAMLARGRNDVVRGTAGWSMAAQLGPVTMGLLLVPVALLELSLDREVIPGAVLGALTMVSLFAGPFMTLVLFVRARGRRSKAPENSSLQSLFAIGLCSSMFLTGCNRPTTAPAPTEKVAATNPASDAEPSVPAAPTAEQLRRVCRAGLAAIHGQDESSITIDALNGPIVHVSWRAPVDGGRRRAQCRVDGDLVIWRPADRTYPVDERWMNEAGDPVTRFVLDGDTVTINTTLPDGTTATEIPTVATEQEVR